MCMQAQAVDMADHRGEDEQNIEMAPMPGVSKDAELARMRSEKQALQEDLIQCQADKEFVWSLWKRLQVANPDITQAISMVLQREKEKNELKDKKVLEILHIKDDRIAELDKIFTQQREDAKTTIHRSEELQEANQKLNEELLAKAQEVESLTEQEGKIRSELQKELSEKEGRVEKLEGENNRLLEENQRLSRTLETHREELTVIEEKNAMLMDKIKEMGRDIHGIGITAETAAKEHTIAAVQLGQAEKDADQWRHRTRLAEEELNKLRNKHVELKQSYQETVDHTSQQLKVITQLQKLQAETQSMLKNQESAHLIEASNYQAMNKELQSRFEAVKSSEDALQKIIAEKTQVTTSDACVQVRTDVRGQTRADGVKGQTVDEEPWVERYAPLRDQLPHADSKNNTRRGQVGEAEESVEGRIEHLQKMMLLKDEELSQMRQAHQGRLGRLRSLQSAYNTVREQIDTYEEHEREPGKVERVVSRPGPKALQKQNSDAVWNELTYYKQRTADLIQENMKLQEEFDQLRVQAATDARALEELSQCLEENKAELHIQSKKLKELKKEDETERKRARALTTENSQLKVAVAELEERQAQLRQKMNEASQGVRRLTAECSRFESQAAANQNKADTLQTKVDRLKRSLIRMRKKNRSLVAEREETGSRRELDEKLSQTLEKMSRILPDMDDWNEFYSQSDDDLMSPLKERLSPGLATSTPRKKSAVRRRVRSNTWTGTSSRQHLSVQRHLTRMARAYEDDQAGETIWKQVSTQTDFDPHDVGITPKKLIHTGVGNLNINDETCTNTSEDTQSDVVPMSKGSGSMVTYTPKPSLKRAKASPGRKAKISIRNLQKRVSTLQQQVTLLKEMKNTLQMNHDDQKLKNERLEGDLTLATHQLQMSRQTVQRLSRELENSRMESALLKDQFKELESRKQEERKQATSTKQMEDRLKTQSQEMSRQSSLIKSLKEQNDEQATTIQTLQEKVKKLDKDSSQKRSLIEDLKAKARACEQDKQSFEEKLESETSRAGKLKEDIGSKKVEVDSLRKQLVVARKEREKWENRWTETKRELDKQKSLLDLSRSRQQEAEKSLTQLEALAGEQLRALTQQSEDALRAARKEVEALRSREVEYRTAIRGLAMEVFKETNQPPPPPVDESDPLSAKEQSLASSILNLSAEDWRGFIDDETQDQSVTQTENLTEDLEKLDRTLELKNFNSHMVIDLFKSSFLQRSR